MSDEINKDTFDKPKPHALLVGLPDYLKDPASYEKIQRALLDAGATKHSHGELVDWAGCKACQKKAWDRKEMMFKLGFKSGAQYLAWRKVHETIIKRVSFAKYNKP